MSCDTELLRRYVEERSEAAFTELVHRHVNLVYSAALRETSGDMGLAQDIAQDVFRELANKAPRLLPHPSVAGWLYRSVRLVAANARRSEQRRRRREEEAHHAMNESLAEGSPNQVWQQVQPELDDALHKLSETDRSAVVLRFLEDRTLREVGGVLGLNENAARMRVDRALDRLRAVLAKRGITSTASGLAAALAAGAVTPAPEAWAATIASAALAGSATAGSTTLAFFQIMGLTKIQLGIIGALVLAGVCTPVWQQTRLRRIEAENTQLRAQQNELAASRDKAGRLSQADSDRAELEQLRKWQAQVQPELMRLRGMAGVARRANAEAAELRAQLAHQGDDATSTSVAGPMGEFMKAAMEQQVSNRLARMTSSLHLTPDQVRSAHDILMRQARVTSTGVQQAFSGKFDKDQLAELGKDAGNTEEQLKALLTPDQQAGYHGYQQEEAAQNARLAANNELLQMQSSLVLTGEQQDRVFAALYEVILSQMNGTSTPSFAAPGELMQWTSDQKAKALESVLTESQLQAYRQQQEIQLKFAKEIMNKMQSPEAGKQP
jgi:RNA polymerase sigma factor (sigma-70 family)